MIKSLKCPHLSTGCLQAPLYHGTKVDIQEEENLLPIGSILVGLTRHFKFPHR